jgi:hypothetical protein
MDTSYVCCGSGKQERYMSNGIPEMTFFPKMYSRRKGKNCSSWSISEEIVGLDEDLEPESPPPVKMAPQRDDKMPPFPIHVDDQGIDIVTIKVGSENQTQAFKIHKWALIKASPYFFNALAGTFKEASDDTIELAEDDPIAFKVLYHYIYSGNVHAANFYSRSLIPDDVLWLRTFKLVHATEVRSLLHIAYARLREEFSPNARTVPSIEFVAELFDPDCPYQELEDFISGHSAWWILNGCGQWTDWVALMDAVPLFGLAVAREIAKRKSGDFHGSKEHPVSDAVFDKDTLFPAPVLAAEVMVKKRGLDAKEDRKGKSVRINDPEAERSS